MPSFSYRALTQSGEIVSGSISAPTAVEVTRRIEYLGGQQFSYIKLDDILALLDPQQVAEVCTCPRFGCCKVHTFQPTAEKE